MVVHAVLPCGAAGVAGRSWGGVPQLVDLLDPHLPHDGCHQEDCGVSETASQTNRFRI